MRFVVLTAALALVAGPAALAQPAAAPAQAQAPSTAPSLEDADPERKICKRVTATGSRLKGYRVCKKARDWQADKDDARQMSEQIQRTIKPEPAG